MRKLISEVGKMAELILAMPANNARSFLKLRFPKALLRNSMIDLIIL